MAKLIIFLFALWFLGYMTFKVVQDATNSKKKKK